MPRSTRNKVRFQVEKASESIERAEFHLKNAFDLAAGKSTPINDYMPNLVVLLESVKVLLLKFRAKL